MWSRGTPSRALRRSAVPALLRRVDHSRKVDKSREGSSLAQAWAGSGRERGSSRVASAATVGRVKRVLVRVGQLCAAAAVVLALGAGSAGADGITPASTTLNLSVGSSTTLHQTLHLDALPPKADVLLAIDSTGSMGTAISEARSDANSIVSAIQAQIPNARFAVANFKDYPFSPFGGSTDYPWQLNQDLTTNGPSANPACPGLTEIQCALNGFSASGGSDNPEAYNRAFYEAYHDPALHWAAGSPRFMIVLGDSLPHDSTQNADFPSCPNTTPTDPGPDGIQGNADDLKTRATLTTLRQNNTNLSFVTYNPTGIPWGSGFTTAGCQKELAEYTGGQQVTRDNTSSLATQ